MTGFEVTDPRTATCEYCDQQVTGRIQVEMHGGSLMVCSACYELLQTTIRKPYSRVMDKFSMRACGYHITRKIAKIRR
jgi:ribosome-binding protein aMBF1 (putative translation factor)